MFTPTGSPAGHVQLHRAAVSLHRIGARRSSSLGRVSRRRGNRDGAHALQWSHLGGGASVARALRLSLTARPALPAQQFSQGGASLEAHCTASLLAAAAGVVLATSALAAPKSSQVRRQRQWPWHPDKVIPRVQRGLGVLGGGLLLQVSSAGDLTSGALSIASPSASASPQRPASRVNSPSAAPLTRSSWPRCCPAPVRRGCRLWRPAWRLRCWRGRAWTGRATRACGCYGTTGLPGRPRCS
jgi:hypothetical protein